MQHPQFLDCVWANLEYPEEYSEKLHGIPYVGINGKP
jgi:hypothetical protein